MQSNRIELGKSVKDSVCMRPERVDDTDADADAVSVETDEIVWRICSNVWGAVIKSV